jgi:hypothetical protein
MAQVIEGNKSLKLPLYLSGLGNIAKKFNRFAQGIEHPQFEFKHHPLSLGIISARLHQAFAGPCQRIRAYCREFLNSEQRCILIPAV